MQSISSAVPGPEPTRDIQLRVADAITAFCGSMIFVYVHVAIFAVWIGARGFGKDHYPFNFLTMAVSLEAIFLSTFILISQNRQQEVAERNNHRVQTTLLQMVNDVVSDEKLDLSNERMIQTLLHRIDVEHIQPMATKLDEIGAALHRMESANEPGLPS